MAINSVKSIRNADMLDALIADACLTSSKYRIMIRLGVETGLRVSDILRLQPLHFVRDIVFSDPWIIERKTRKLRFFSVSNVLQVQIERHITEYGLGLRDYLIFSRPTRTNKPLSRVQAYRIMRRSATRVGLKHIGTHSMRKTYALDLFRRTKDIYAVQRALNHKYVETTMRYIFSADDFAGLDI